MTSPTTRLSLPVLWVIIGILLSGCQHAVPDARYLGPPARQDLASCDGNQILPLMGQPVSALPAAGGWGTLRVIRPGMAVTEDYSDTRLNVELDAQDRIIGLSCG